MKEARNPEMRKPKLPDSSASKESACNAEDGGLIPGSGRSPEEEVAYPPPVFLGFPGGSDGKESTCSVGDLGLILGLGISPGDGNSYPLQYSCLNKNSTDRKLYRQRRIAGYSPWNHKELDMTEGISCLQAAIILEKGVLNYCDNFEDGRKGADHDKKQ